MADVISNKVYESIQPHTPIPETTGTILYANQFADVPQVQMPDDIKALLDSDVGMVGPNLIIQLEQKFKHFRNGPWYVDSRDGILYIHNRKFQEEPVGTYVYYNEPGEVIKITLSTQYVTKSTKIVLHETIDPVTKEVEDQVTKIDDIDINPATPIIVEDNLNVGRQPGAANKYGIHYSETSGWSSNEFFSTWDDYETTQGTFQTKAQAQSEDKVATKLSTDAGIASSKTDSYNAYMESLTAGDYQNMINNVINAPSTPTNVKTSLEKLMSNMGNISDPNTFDSLLRQVTENLVYFADNDKTTYYSTNVLDYSAAGTPGTAVGTTSSGKTIYKMTGFEIPLYKLYTGLMARYGGTQKYLWAANANANGGLKNKEKVLTMNMTVVGRPSLKSSMVINVQNIGTRWSGPWYVKKCTHKMDPSSGYLCDLELVQNKSRAGQSTTRAGWSTQNVLHVQTTKNGTTSYSIKPESSQTNFTMDAFTNTDYEYFEGKYGSASQEGTMTNSQAATFQRDIAVNQLYYEKNASQPSLQAKGVYSTHMTYSESAGDISQLSIKRNSASDLGITEEEIADKVSSLTDLRTFKTNVLQSIKDTKKSLEGK